MRGFAYTVSMMSVNVTDSQREEGSIDYIEKSVSPLASDFCGSIKKKLYCDRVGLRVDCPIKYLDLFRQEIEDKVADVIAVRYKYLYLKRRLRCEGLPSYEKELLFAALIAADLEDDKAYIIRKIRNMEIFTVDGIFNFRIKPLKYRWREIVSCIPPYFSSVQLSDFIAYLVGEKRGKRVVLENGRVYDGNKNELMRSSLIDGKGDPVREILLSAGGKIEVIGSVNSQDERYLKSFFGRRITFLGGSLAKTVDKKI